jgi:hypothetical protein
MPAVMTKTVSILEGVKRRGAEAGDFMDPTTEEVVRNQVRMEVIVSCNWVVKHLVDGLVLTSLPFLSLSHFRFSRRHLLDKL